MGDDGLEAGLNGSAATGRQLVVENCGTVLVLGFTAKRLIGPSSRLGDFLDDEVWLMLFWLDGGTGQLVGVGHLVFLDIGDVRSWVVIDDVMVAMYGVLSVFGIEDRGELVVFWLIDIWGGDIVRGDRDDEGWGGQLIDAEDGGVDAFFLSCINFMKSTRRFIDFWVFSCFPNKSWRIRCCNYCKEDINILNIFSKKILQM